MYAWTTTSAVSTANLFLAAISVDRVVGMKYPIWYRNNLELGISTFHVHRACLSGIILVHIFCLQVVFTFSTKYEPGNCSTNSILSLMATSLLGQATPFAVLFVSNVVFSRALLSRRKSKFSPKNNAVTTEEHELEERNLPNVANSVKLEQEMAKMKNEINYIRMLFLVTSAFLFFNMPSVVFFLFSSTFRLNIHNVKEDTREFLYLVAGLCLGFNHSSNIVFYIMSGPMYRKALMQALAACFGYKTSGNS